ncbi:Integral membrane protein SED5, partial [Coemansia brasiliensis]
MSTSKNKSLRDRTQEYRSLATALRKRQQHSPEPRQRPSNASFGEFSRQASSISKEIQSTALLLEKLATLARGKTIFDDRTDEINGLTAQVKQRIAAINGKIMTLQQLQRRQNGAAHGAQQTTEHHSNVVLSLQSQLANTSTTFKDVLELRSESLKESGHRREQFIGSAAAAAGNLAFSST